MGTAAMNSIDVPVSERGRPLDYIRSDSKLLSRLRSGDKTAFPAIFARHYQLVFAVSMGVLGTREDAEDVAQEVFAGSVTKLTEAENPPDNLKAWFARVTRNAAIDLYRARKDSAPLTQENSAPSLGDGPQQATQQHEELEHLLANLKDLPERQRSTLLMREIVGSSYQEIATAMDVTEDTVRDLIQRARLNLRFQRVAEDTPCTAIREQLAASLDARSRSRDVKHHLRRCSGCKEFDQALRNDRKLVRGIAPPVAIGLLWQVEGALAATKAGLGSVIKQVAVHGSLSAKIAAAGVVATTATVTVVAVSRHNSGQKDSPATVNQVRSDDKAKTGKSQLTPVPKDQAGKTNQADETASGNSNDSKKEESQANDGHSTKQSKSSSSKEPVENSSEESTGPQPNDPQGPAEEGPGPLPDEEPPVEEPVPPPPTPVPTPKPIPPPPKQPPPPPQLPPQ